jgi:hypothetical protein
MAKIVNPVKELQEQLFEDTKGARCPYIQRDETGPYCGKGLEEGGDISEERRLVCDTASLQLWCLHETDFKRCTYYKEGFRD